MSKEKLILNKSLNISKEEKEATENALEDYFKKHPDFKERNIESQSRKIISSINPEELEKLEIKKEEFESEIKRLEIEQDLLEKEKDKSNTNAEWQEKTDYLQIIIEKIENNKEKIKKIEEELKEIKNILLKAGMETSGIESNKN